VEKSILSSGDTDPVGRRCIMNRHIFKDCSENPTLHSAQIMRWGRNVAFASAPLWDFEMPVVVGIGPDTPIRQPRQVSEAKFHQVRKIREGFDVG
jgi:hypothetical protein